MVASSIPFALVAGLLANGLTPVMAAPAPASPAAEEFDMKLMGDVPSFPSDPNTTHYCSWWWDNDGSIPCANMPGEWGISLADFLRWVSQIFVLDMATLVMRSPWDGMLTLLQNPSITSTCGNYITSRSYCVEAAGEPSPGQPGASTSTPAPVATPTAPSNGIETPQPTQPGMVSNCNKFDLVKTGDGCSSITSRNGITFSQLLAWNSGVGSNCEGLWANVNVCVGAIGSTPVVTPTPTPTKPANGVTTPQPTQPGMVSNCNKFDLVKTGDGCSTVTARNGITFAQLLQWNTGVGSNCEGLWANVNVCVGTIGSTPVVTPTPTPTKPANGVTTPQPTQPGMVSNCNKFYLAKSGDSCDKIASSGGITFAQLLAWNSGVKSDCTGLWANTNVCVGVIGQTTTPPKPTSTIKGNGVATPTPIQNGMVTNCRIFHFVKSGETCDVISKARGITVANFIKWNPAVGSNCGGLWANTYACVALI
ncbi:LysM domain-containing protein-like protein 6 [Colletotrichum chlorophyti]|uniref:LysM domain-containing protein-like protein 6 n=1 Tax=Colletotrichum chlorophyti TaxID=708187 RepID=A0A1Q8RWH2_9PEZI|nr:LysM domain-containing protein-like protein 6 [Colletotrichum chlorophyti]